MSVNSVDFEPSLIADRTYTSRQLPTKVDVAATLSFMVGLLYIIPGQAIVPNLTGAGRPALLVALLLWCWWLMVRLNPWLTMVGPQPLRWAALVYLLSLLLSYLAGLMRGLPSLESNAENLAVLQCFEFLGILLTAADGIPNWQRLKGVLRVFVWCAGFMALIGIVQSVLKYDPTPHLVLPGLTLKGEIDSLHPRGTGGLYRVAGTASHFIEFSAVMAMAVPFAIHFARFATKRWQRRLAVAVAVGCGAAVPISISRTGIVALAAAIVVMFPVWHWRLRYTFLVLGAGLTAALSVVRPGLIGTVSAMFTGLNEDPSIQGRTDDYTRVGQWFNERPWLGRGPWTLIPDLYQGMVLDNEWLYTLVTQGLFGIVALAAVHLTCITLAGIALKRSTSIEDRHLCAALIAAQVICILVEGTVDAFYYTTYSMTFALLAGLCGAVWRFTHPARTVRTSAVRRFIRG